MIAYVKYEKNKLSGSGIEIVRDIFYHIGELDPILIKLYVAANTS